jgi:DNA-binding LacI/PurR family transcriptional regulator
LKAKELMSLPKPPDAIYAVNDPVAIEAMKVVKEIGLKIPFHVGIIGFNNEPITDLLSPKLSSVNIPSKKMGHHAAQILIDQIEGENIRIVTETLPCELVIRESSNRRAFLRKNKITEY